MPYPKIHLTRPFRLGFMIGLIILFFIISPLVILYTVGYRYDVRTNTLSETGVISIDIEPRDATVKLNDILIEKKMPIRLANRAPGRYELTISKSGYHTLKKDIEVTSKQTTYIRDVPLFKDTLPTELFSAPLSPDARARISFDGRYMTVLESKNDSDTYTVQVIDIGTEKILKTTSFVADTVPHIEWSPFHASGFILFTANKQTHYHFFSVQEDTAKTEYAPISTTTPSFQWNQKNTGSLFIKDGNNIILLSQSGTTVFATTTQPVWYIDHIEQLWQFDLSTHRLIRNQAGQPSNFWKLSETLVDIFSIENGSLIGRTPRGVVLINLVGSETSTMQLPTEAVYYNMQRDEWLSWSESEIWKITDGKAGLLTRLGLPIHQVFPLDDFGTLLIDTGEKLFGFHPQFFSIQPLFEHGTVNTLGVNQKTRVIYFTGHVGNKTTLFELLY